MTDFLRQAHELLPQLIRIRRDLHRFPEVGGQEFRTTRIIKEFLHRCDIEVTNWGGDTGAVGLLGGAAGQPVVALRADIDALAIQEENDVPYRSQKDGFMHACGHDVHTTCLLGAAQLLARQRASLAGTVKLIFQPAEEIGGAREMVAKGVLQNPDVNAIFGIHNQPGIPVGQIGIKKGALMGANHFFKLLIQGVGGHGAMPHKTKDPIVAAAVIIQSLQTILNRYVNPLDAGVISFGSIHGGQVANVIPSTVEITGTVRNFTDDVFEIIRQNCERIVQDTAKALGLEAEIVFSAGFPAVDNDADLVRFCYESLGAIYPAEDMICPESVLVTEDFSLYQKQVPGVMLWPGSGNAARGITHAWHSPQFDVDEEVIAYGAASLAQLAVDYLRKTSCGFGSEKKK